MTNEKFKVSSKKPLQLWIISLLALLPLAFSIGLMAASTSSGDGEEFVIDTIKLIIITAIVFIGVSAIHFLLCRMFAKSERFYFEDGKLHYSFAFIIKKKVSLPLEKINIVKTKRNLIDLIIGTSTVEIGSGNINTGLKAEIRLCLDKEKAQYVVGFLQRYSKAVKENTEFNEEFNYPSFSPESTDTNDSVTVKMTKADKLRYVFTSSAFWVMLLFSVALVSLPYAIRHFLPAEFIEQNFNEFALALLISSIACFTGTLLSLICFAFISFYNYTVTRKGDEIIIHYGLLNVKTFSVSFDKIHGYSIGQSLFKQIFKIGSLRLSVIGIDESGGNNTSTATYAYPCGKISKLNEIIASLLPEFVYEKELVKSTKQSVLHTVLIPNAYRVLALLPALIYLAIAVSVWLLIIPMLIVIILGTFRSFLIYKHAGFAIDSNFVCAVSGGFLKKHTLIKTGSVQAINTFAGFIRRRQKLCTYLVIYRGSSLLSNKVLIRNVPEASLDSLK